MFFCCFLSGGLLFALDRLLPLSPTSPLFPVAGGTASYTIAMTLLWGTCTNSNLVTSSEELLHYTPSQLDEALSICWPYATTPLAAMSAAMSDPLLSANSVPMSTLVSFSAKVTWGAPWKYSLLHVLVLPLLLLQRGPPQQPNLEFTGTFLFSQLPHMLAPA